MEKKVLINWEGKETEVIVRGLSYMENTAIVNRATKINPLTQNADVNLELMQQQYLIKGIKSAPFEINLDNIYKLDNESGEKLVNTIRELSGLTPMQKKTSNSKLDIEPKSQ